MEESMITETQKQKIIRKLRLAQEHIRNARLDIVKHRAGYRIENSLQTCQNKLANAITDMIMKQTYKE